MGSLVPQAERETAGRGGRRGSAFLTPSPWLPGSSRLWLLALRGGMEAGEWLEGWPDSGLGKQLTEEPPACILGAPGIKLPRCHPLAGGPPSPPASSDQALSSHWPENSWRPQWPPTSAPSSTALHWVRVPSSARCCSCFSPLKLQPHPDSALGEGGGRQRRTNF